MLKVTRVLSTAVICAAIAGCQSISPFNEYAYEHDTSLKVDAIALVNKSNESYSQHSTEVAALEAHCLKEYEYAKGLPKNEDTANQWKIITDPNGDSLFAYFELWKSEGQVSPAEAKDASDQLSKHFDQIIQLESGKVKSK